MAPPPNRYATPMSFIPQPAHLFGRSAAREDFVACIAATNDNDKGSKGGMDASRT
jgi:hypothetical protein